MHNDTLRSKIDPEIPLEPKSAEFCCLNDYKGVENKKNLLRFIKSKNNTLPNSHAESLCL